MTNKLLVDTRGAAHMLTMSVRSVERLAASGELPSVKIGGLRRFRTLDLVGFCAALGDNGGAVGDTPTAPLAGSQVQHGRRRSGS